MSIKETKISNPDCLIFTNENPTEKGIQVLHVREGIVHYPESEHVRICCDIIMNNTCEKPLRCRIVHPAKTTAKLCKFSLEDKEDPRREILTRLFSERIKTSEKNPDTINFHKRINCIGVDPTFIEVSLLGPNKCFEKNDNIIPLDPETPHDNGYCAFSSYLLPPLCKDHGVTICTVQLELEGESYTELVKDGSDITVESYTHLKKDLETYAIPFERNEKRIDLYKRNIMPEASLIEPKEYDIVIFQKLGKNQPLILLSGDISAPQMKSKVVPPKEAICFLGQPKDFCLRFSYPKEVVQKRAEKLLRSRKFGFQSNLNYQHI